jgi:hypothetical protein
MKTHRSSTQLYKRVETYASHALFCGSSYDRYDFYNKDQSVRYAGGLSLAEAYAWFDGWLVGRSSTNT